MTWSLTSRNGGMRTLLVYYFYLETIFPIAGSWVLARKQHGTISLFHMYAAFSWSMWMHLTQHFLALCNQPKSTDGVTVEEFSRFEGPCLYRITEHVVLRLKKLNQIITNSSNHQSNHQSNLHYRGGSWSLVMPWLSRRSRLLDCISHLQACFLESINRSGRVWECLVWSCGETIGLHYILPMNLISAKSGLLTMLHSTEIACSQPVLIILTSFHKFVYVFGRSFRLLRPTFSVTRAMSAVVGFCSECRPLLSIFSRNRRRWRSR